MKSLAKLILILLTISVLSACEEDFDLNAPYQDITVVYGMIDLNEDTTVLKINKAFLGEGDVLTMAKIEDSSLYKQDISVTVTAFDDQNNQRGEYFFEPSTISNKEEGLFYNPLQQVYTAAFEPNENYRYHLLVQVGDKQVSASTPVVQTFSITRPSAGQSFINIKYESSPTFEWVTARNGLRYELVIRFNFRELFDNNPDTTSRHIDWVLGTRKAINDNGGVEMEQAYLGNSFYAWIEDQVPYKDAGKESSVIRRFTVNLEYIVYVAAEELNTYMEVNEPTSSIIQEKPEYTNIENGLGIFSSRLKNSRTKKIHPETIQEIKNLSTDLKFEF